MPLTKKTKLQSDLQRYNNRDFINRDYILTAVMVLLTAVVALSLPAALFEGAKNSVRKNNTIMSQEYAPLLEAIILAGFDIAPAPGDFGDGGDGDDGTGNPYSGHQWATDFPPLIAHSGGGYRHETGYYAYTNSVEALIQNYHLGHRIFEFDFRLTSDGKMAVCHDWYTYGTRDGVPMSEAAWRAHKPVPTGAYKPAMLGDILDEMMDKKDIFIVTDTKSFEETPEDALRQFQILYDEAVARDPELLSRIVPQIYNEWMYDFIAHIHEYESVIYTLYASPSSGDEIFDFVRAHDRVKVVTMPYALGHFDTDLPARLASIGKLVYVHTVNDYDQIIPLSRKGAHGFYTDFFTPAVFEIYQEIIESSL